MSKPSKRAGAPVEIEITQEMISAGAAVLADYDLLQTELSLLAREVFLAMRRKQEHLERPLTGRPCNHEPSKNT